MEWLGLGSLVLLCPINSHAEQNHPKELVQQVVQWCVDHGLGPTQVEWLLGNPILSISEQSGPIDYQYDWPITEWYRCGIHIQFRTSQFPRLRTAERVHGGIQ